MDVDPDPPPDASPAGDHMPASYRGKKVRWISIMTGVLRILLALATIPIQVEAIRQHSFPGDGFLQYISFYWTDVLVCIP